MSLLKQLREALRAQQSDVLIITSNQNRRYLTGFTGSAGTVVITPTQALLLVDFRYTQQATNQSKEFDVREIDRSRLYETIQEILDTESIQTIGFEQQHVTYEVYQLMSSKLTATLKPLSNIVENLRTIKTPEEIELIKKAAWISDEAFKYILTFIKPGVSEIDIANELEFHMRKNGATGAAFDIIIASGHRSALPHGVASDKIIEEGDMLTLDFGAYYQGYRSDMTRTIAVGEPSGKLKEIYQIVYDSLQITLSNMKAGITGKEVDSYSRDFIKAKGYGKNYGHGSGHGLGLDLHENIFMSTVCEDILEENMVLTVEPGIYIPDLGGVRIEDDVIVTKNGVEVITHSPKELIIL
ncbi:MULTISPECIES: Xaa-Pro peptidase family protein [unclassified Lysinibacillus]|uniref:M24 family metallopeptidase n=1 Tax=unclassified Lysinibacillus TaxID=2636778 RepID=UPI002556EE13|nr:MULTISPECIES: Xaa-Pro peptidase family protein [unclassified Lysinibacillus]MDM5250532.1 Xaa-Pro peptidase family protein [Lysinibacillus sp. G4S2]